jgi:hypothetical protein
MLSGPQLLASFDGGLGRLPEREDLGVYILLLANCVLQAELFDAHKERLRSAFGVHGERVRRELGAGREPVASPDDLAVFLRLMAIGFEQVPPVESRSAGRFELHLNLLRALRPARISKSLRPGLHIDFDPKGFHFNRSFLQQELCWKGDLLGHQVGLFYNKFPFVPRHLLLVPDGEDCMPQYLRPKYHHFLWSLLARWGAETPGVGAAYNSYGAYASVNHLHFQLFVRPRPLPLQDAGWAHNGGAQPYPLACQVFDDPDRAWAAIADLHDRGQSYNLLYRPGRMFCLPRRRQGSYAQAAWTPGFAWCELSGAITLSDADVYARMTERDVIEQMALLVP